MTKMAQKHDLTFKNDPLNDKREMLGAMKMFKDAKVPTNPFKNGKPRGAHDDDFKGPGRSGPR